MLVPGAGCGRIGFDVGATPSSQRDSGIEADAGSSGADAGGGPTVDAAMNLRDADLTGDDASSPVVDGGSGQPRGTAVTLAGTGTAGLDDGPLATATFRLPRDVMVAPEGIYVADNGNLALRLVTPDGRVRTIAGGGPAGYADGRGAEARFSRLGTLARLPDGSVLVSDDFNHVFRRVAADGTVSTFAGSGARGYREGLAAEAQFDEPAEAFVASDGTIFIADKQNRLIRKLAGGRTSVHCGAPGAARAVVDGRCDGAARFDFPTGIEGDDRGNLYVTEFSANVVRRIAPDGTVATIMGTGVRGWADGEGTSAVLSRPARLRFEARTGLLWVQEQEGGHRLRFWNGSTVTTVFGPRDGSFIQPAFQDGEDPRFCHADGLDVDVEGCLIVGDNCSHRIRRACPP